MAPCSSSFASLNLNHSPAGQSYRDMHICREQAAAAWWHSLLSVRSVTGSQILNLPIMTINAWVKPLPPAQLQSLWQAAEAGMNLPLITKHE